MANCHSSKFSTPRRFKFLRKCGRLIMVPVICLASIPAYAQTWLGATNNGTAGEFNWTEITNWSGGAVPNAIGATATFGPASPGGIVVLDTPITLGALNFNSGAIYTLNGGANLLTFDQGGPGLIDIDMGDVTIAADLAVSGGGLNIEVDPAPVVVHAEISGAIGGVGPITKQGIGTLILSGANTYSGETVITAGTLQLGVAGAIPDGSAVSVAAGATFDLNNFSETIGSLSGAGSVLLGTDNLTTGSNGNSTTFSGIISESGDLIKEGGGVFTLTGINTYTGNTLLNAGTLSIGSIANLGTTAGDIIFDGGTLRTTATLTVPHDVQFNAGGGTIETVGFANISTFTGDFTGTGTLTKDGLGRLLIDNNLTVFGGDIVIGEGTLENVTNGDETLSGDITGQGNFVKSGPGVLNLSGNNNAYVGNIFITGGRLRSLAPGTIGDASNVIISTGATLDLNNNDEVLGGLFGDIGSSVVLNGATLTTSNDAGVNDSTFNGVISGNMNSEVIKVGDGVLTLGGANTFEGMLTIQEGIVRLNPVAVGADGVLANRMELQILTDAVFDLNGFSETIGPLSGNGDVTLGIGTLTVNSEDTNGDPSDSTFTGRVIGTGGLTKVGGGRWSQYLHRHHNDQCRDVATGSRRPN